MQITLYRYIIKEQLAPLTVCLLGLGFILITGRLLQLTRYLFTSSLTLWDLAELMALAVPKLLLYVLPMATLIGVLLAFVRLNNDNELVALRAAGIGFRKLLPPVLSVAVLMTAVSFYNTLSVLPSANRAFEMKLRSLGKASLPAILKEGSFIDIIPKLVFFFRSVDTSNLTIEGIFVQDQRQQDVRLAITAESAQITFDKAQSNITFKISNGIITRVADDLKDAQAVSFKEYDLNISLDELMGTSKGSRGRREMSLAELYAEIRDKTGTVDIRYSMEFHQRLSLPLACLLLGLVGAPLGAMFRRKSRMTGITVGIGIFLAYYIILSAGTGLAENRLLSPFAALWLPNLFAALIAGYLWIKIQNESPFAPGAVRKRLELLSAKRQRRKKEYEF
jgi:lipopolysaccharide export system permease protein